MSTIPLPVTITIGIEDHFAKLTEQVANIEGAEVDIETLLMDCFDWAKFSYSPDFIDSILRKVFGKYLDQTPEEDEEDSPFDRFSETVVNVVNYFQEQIQVLKLMGEDEYIPYRVTGMLGKDTIILQYRRLRKTNLENEESKRFRFIEALVDS